jgi:choline-glycine betaine transporter
MRLPSRLFPAQIAIFDDISKEMHPLRVQRQTHAVVYICPLTCRSAEKCLQLAASGAAEWSRMNLVSVFSLFAFILMLVLLPILFGELMATSLGKLHLSPELALLLMMAIIIGGLIGAIPAATRC